MTPTRKRPMRRRVVVAGAVAGVLLFVLASLVVSRTRTATGTRHYTNTRLLPLREWGFGTNSAARIAVPLAVPPGTDVLYVNVCDRNAGQGGWQIAGAGIGVVARSGGPHGARYGAIALNRGEFLGFEAPGGGRANVLVRGRSTRYGFLAIERYPRVDARYSSQPIRRY